MKKINLLLAVVALLTQFSLSAQTVYYWEQFDGSANGWESDVVSPLDSSFWAWSNNKWEWTPNGDPSSGAFWTNPTNIQSETQANGSMIFNADFYSTQGVAANAPPQPYISFVCHLVSPIIDLSAVDPTEGLRLQFTQFVRYLNISSGAPGGFRLSVSWTTDNGLTWSNPRDITQNGTSPAVNSAINGNIQNINLPAGIQTSSEFRVRFTWASQFYFWIIDDVKIISRPPHDMQANNDWYAIAPNRQWPGSQLEPMSFMCDISNQGGQTQTNVNLNMTVVDNATMAVAYTADKLYGSIIPDSIAENEIFGAFTPPSSPAAYTATYTVSADSTDLIATNNSLSFQFAITDTVFAKEVNPTTSIYPALGNWDEDEPRSWAWGNHYYVPNGEGWYANTATFSIAPTAAAEGQTIQVVLYDWNDNNQDGNADPGERTSVANYLYTIVGNETAAQLITVPLTNIFTGLTPELSDDTDYLLCIEFSAEDQTEVRFGAASGLEYDAMEFMTEQLGKPRYNYLLGINDNLDEEPYSSGGFTASAFAAAVRLNIGQTPLFSNTKEQLNSGEIVKIFPNPANDYVSFDVKLNEASSTVRVLLLDLTGKMVAMQEFQNLKDLQATFKTNELANGTYFVRIDTDFGYTTRKFVVQK